MHLASDLFPSIAFVEVAFNQLLFHQDRALVECCQDFVHDLSQLFRVYVQELKD